MMKKRIASIICMLLAIILMGTHFGVAMTFAPGPIERIPKYFSYFSLAPVGYANWFPIITGVSVCVAVLHVITLVLQYSSSVKLLIVNRIDPPYANKIDPPESNSYELVVMQKGIKL